MNGSKSKALLRKDLKDRLRIFTQEASLRIGAETLIVEHLFGLISGAGVVAGFNSLSDEPDLSRLYTTLPNSLAFPKLVDMSSDMQFTRVENYTSEVWGVSSLGFRHPSSHEEVPSDQIQYMLIPGIGFSKFGERLGRGKGFYDRYLQNFKGLKIGVCFDCQWSEAHLPTDSWDIKMDYIVTENKCVEIEE